jgi:hypothetical protein
VGFEAGGTVTEITGNSTVWAGAAYCASCAKVGIHGESDSEETTARMKRRPAQLLLRRITAKLGNMETPRVTRPVARHRELGVPLIRQR